MADYTAQDYIDATVKAVRAGNTAAAEELRAAARQAQEAEDRVRYAPERKPEDSSAGVQLAAGLHRLGQGLGQTFGVGDVTPQSVRDADRVRARLKEEHPLGGALQFVGENAPGVIVPGGTLLRGGALAANIGRSALTGAASAGALGYAGATGEEDVQGAKARNAGTAAALGGVLSPVLGSALPAVANALGGVYRRSVGAWRSPAVAEREAQDLFSRNIGDQAGAERALAQEVLRPTPRVGGPRTVGETVGSDEAIQLEQLLKGRGGQAAQPLIEREAAVDTALLQELRGMTNPQRLAQLNADAATPGSINNLYAQLAGQGRTPLRAPIVNPAGPDVDAILTQAINRNQGPVREALADVAAQWNIFRGAAQNNNSWGTLYKFRKEILDDASARLMGENRPNVANEVNAILQRDVRPALDATIAHASGGQSGQFFGPGSRGAAMMTEREQLAKAQEVMDWLQTQSQRTRSGDPSTLTSPVYSQMQKLLQEENKYGASPLSPQMRATVQEVIERAQGLRSMGSAEVEAMGTQAARALPGVANTLRVGGTPPWTMQNVTAYGVGALLTRPELAALAAGGGFARQKAQAAIARELGQISANPATAMRAIREARRRTREAEAARQRNRMLGVLAGSTLGSSAGSD